MTADIALEPKRVAIHVPAIPKRLVITPTMVEDFIINPALGARVLFGEDLDAFQTARLKICWWVPRVMDTSGFSSAKTKGLWIVSNLRCLLIPDHIVGVYYQVFATGQKTYWRYFGEAARRSPIFRAHIGRINAEGESGGKGELKGPSCWTVTYKNGSEVQMPAPSFLQDARTQASIRLNDLYIDEWTKIEATGSTGIDDQLIGRATRDSFCQHHPFWTNHHLFLATAEDSMHPAYDRYKSYVDEVAAGNPDYAVISYCYKDYSNLPHKPGKTFADSYRNEMNLRDMRKNKSEQGFRQEGLGIWQNNGKTLYSRDMVDAAIANGIERRVRPICSQQEDPVRDPARKMHVYYFLGLDPAKADNSKADDGSLVALRAQPRVGEGGPNPRDWFLDWVWAYKVRRADAPKWAEIVHRKERHFGFSGMLMDPGGGGNWIRPELAKTKQVINGEQVTVAPIACIEDEGSIMVHGKFMLSMFKITDHRISTLWGHMNLRGPDNLVDVAHTEFIDAWSLGLFALPPDLRDVPQEERKTWTQEKVWASQLLSVMASQLTKITVQTEGDGKVFYTKHGARVFGAKGRKDFAYAAMYAYVRFLAFLKGHENEFHIAEEDAAQCG